MDMNDAIDALGALAQEGRLRVFRLLMAYGPEGLPAGEVARKLDVAPNTLSSQFAVLCQAGLLQSRRAGRSIIYSVDLSGMRGLLTYLVQDCCQGRAEVCGPLLDAAIPDCCPSQESSHETTSH